MTINVAVTTSEALVLGCDSIASVVEYLVDPFECTAQGEPEEDGSFLIKVRRDDIGSYVTNTWDGVTKMFQLHGGSCPVAAVTAGLAKLNNRSMSSYANEFYTQHGGSHPITWPTGPAVFNVTTGGTFTNLNVALGSVEEVANEFLKFMRSHYDAHYADSKLPAKYWDSPDFLVGGYDPDKHLPSLYRVLVGENSVVRDYPSGEFGVSWQGQSDAVERLLRGYDSLLKGRIEKEVQEAFASAHKAYGEAVASIVQAALDKIGQKLPDGVSMEIPEAPKASLPWDRFATAVSYGNLPLQDAVHFCAYLVGLQSGKARFARGVATVGGRTHIGVITKADGFKMLGEPELKHTNVGFI